jgi:hypothetical protein
MVMNRSSDEGFWSNWPFADFLHYWDFRPRTSWFQHFEKSPGLGDLSADQRQSLAKLRQLAKDVDASLNGYWMRHG